MKRHLTILVWFSIVFFGVPASASTYDPLSGLGSGSISDQPADTSGSQGVVTLDDLTDGSDTAGSTDEMTILTEQIKSQCTEAQITAYQPKIDACFGGEDACNGYTSASCLAQEAAAAEETILSIPLSCFFECIGIKMQQCKPVLDLLLASCQPGAIADTASSPGSESTGTEFSDPDVEVPSTGECVDKKKVLRNGYCVCPYGYQMNIKTGECDFITTGANLDADGIEKINDMVAAADVDPNGTAMTTIIVNGKEVTVGVSADPRSYGTYRYTIDGIHYASSLSGAIAPGFWSRVGNSVLDGSRRGLSMISPFNWFTGRYKGEDKSTKYTIGREVIYDDIDAQRMSRVKYLKYMNDFLNGMSLYIDLRQQGKTPQQIASGAEDINVEINQATERMRTAANPTRKEYTDEEKAQLQAAHDHDMYRAFEDGYLRYQLRLKLQATQETKNQP